MAASEVFTRPTSAILSRSFQGRIAAPTIHRLSNVARVTSGYHRGMAKRFLVCPPTHYAVTYDINPWMTRNVGYSAPNAQRQWDRFIETLGCAGAVEFVHLT